MPTVGECRVVEPRIRGNKNKAYYEEVAPSWFANQTLAEDWVTDNYPGNSAAGQAVEIREWSIADWWGIGLAY